LAAVALAGYGQDALGFSAGTMFIAGAAIAASAFIAAVLRSDLPLVLCSQAGTILLLWLVFWGAWA
jgi:hypothetical protein